MRVAFKSNIHWVKVGLSVFCVSYLDRIDVFGVKSFKKEIGGVPYDTPVSPGVTQVRDRGRHRCEARRDTGARP